jgi:sugar (pentulose or hexulose) kinase
VTAPLLMGIDVGTTRAKVGAFYLDGRAAAMTVAHYPHALHTAGDAAEQDAAEWWLHIYKAIRATVERIDASAILGVCVGGQGPTMVAMDESFTPVAPALTWMDRRAVPQAKMLSERAQRHVPPHSFLAKAMWFAQANPGAYAQTRWFCQAWDLIATQLTGEAVVSTAAGVVPWDDELVAAAALDAQNFPPMRRMGERVGSVSDHAAQFRKRKC